jgi:ABC-2 type transport system permease protein
VAFGLAAIWVTVAVSATNTLSLQVKSDLLAVVLALWAFGWAFGPMLFGGEDKTLQPEHFRFLPVTAQKLAAGLLGASFVSVPVAVSLLAFSALAVYGFRLSPVAGLVAIPALMLQLGFTVALSRLVTAWLREYTKSLFSVVISSLITGVVIAFMITGWAVFAVTDDIFAIGLPHSASVIIHSLPSGWGIAAIDAAHEGKWLIMGISLLGLAVLTALVPFAWSRLLQRRLTTTRTRGSSGRQTKAAMPGVLASPIGGVILRELLTWVRDYTRSGHLYFSFFYAVAICLFPLFSGVSELLPLAGILFVLSVAGSTANLYGTDGTALWMTLTTPRASKYDVYGRQLAWLVLVAPIALALTVLLCIVPGHSWALPGALALTFATVGAGAGIVVWNSVYQPFPLTDPHKRGDDPFDSEISPGQFIVVFLGVAMIAAPTAAMLWLSVRFNLPWAEWLSIPVGLFTGAYSSWLLGRLAAKKLETRGAELFQLILKGPTKPAEGTEAGSFDALPLRIKLIVWTACTIAPIALFPQGIVPLVIKLTSSDVRSWFLALYLPEAVQWPVIAFMISLGLAIGGALSYFYLRHKKQM